MRIVLDASGPLGVAPAAEAAVRALRELDCALTLAGPEKALRDQLARFAVSPTDPRVEYLATEESIRADEDPVRACREKPDSSIMLAAKAVAEGRADALLSTGHRGAAVVAALWHMKRLPGVLKPALAAPVFTLKGTALLLDAGANSDCKPWHLLQFAAMGSIYAREAFKIGEPRVGLLASGDEDSNVSDLVRDALPLLKNGGMKFVGAVDGRKLLGGEADVVVCDGFAGGVALRTSEAASSAVFELIGREAASGLRSKLGASLLDGRLSRLRARLSEGSRAGVPLLGVSKPAILSGGSDAEAVFGAVRAAKEFAGSEILAKLKAEFERLGSNVELSKVLD